MILSRKMMGRYTFTDTDDPKLWKSQTVDRQKSVYKPEQESEEQRHRRQW